MTDPAPRPPARVLVVDPDDRTRESLCGLLGIGARCAVVGSAGDLSRGIALVGELQPDIVVVDANLEDAAAATDFVRHVRAVSPSTRIVAMSLGDAAAAQRRCAGVDGVIRKTFRPRELVDALLGAGVAPA